MYILEMSQLCYDFEKWSIFTLSAILAVNLVGLALLLSQWLELETKAPNIQNLYLIAANIIKS